MTIETKKKFNWRSFISLYMTFSGIIIAVSGFILYIAPAGRIAHWTHIPILGLEKDQWQALHIIFTFILVIAAGFHIYYNWRPLMAYLKTRINQKVQLRKELGVSSLLTVALFFVVLAEVQPFTSVLDFGEYVKDSWATEQNEPPVPHAEEMSIEELAKTLNKPVDALLAGLKENGLDAEKTDVVGDLAERTNKSPLDIFTMMNLMPPKQTNSSVQGKGYGRMNLEQLCGELNIAPDRAIKRLQKAGIEAQKTSTLKALASDYSKRPIDLVNLIKGEKTE